MKNPAVDAYIARSAAFARPILAHIRSLVHKGCPRIEESIKWGVPNFEHKGIVAMMAAFKQHVSFGFWSEELPKQKLGKEAAKMFPTGAERGMGGRKFRTRSDLPPDDVVIRRLGIALVPETRDIFSYLTARENLAIARRPASRWQMDTVLERFPSLKERLNNKGRQLSGGEQQMLAIARALLTGPDLLLLDEPSQGLAPLVVNAVMSTIQELKKERVSMLLVEQNAEMALRLADRVYVIDHGTVVFEGTPAALRADRQVTMTYLGVGG